METAEQIYCIKCGKQNPAAAKICYYCGALLVNQKPAEVKPEPQPVEPAPASYQPAPVPDYQIPPPPQTLPNYNYGPPPYGQTPPPFYGAPPPYGQPFIPRVPVAPNGKPYVVIENPDAFYNYTNKDSKQVFAAFSSFSIRMAGAFIDSLIMSVPLFIVRLVVFLIMLSPSQLLSDEVLTDNPDVIRANNWIILIWGTLYLIYTVGFTAWKGRTIGHRVMGIKVMKLDGTIPDFRSALIRNLFGYSWFLSGVISSFGNDLFNILGILLELMVIIGFMSAAFHPRKQGWHDRLAETVVVHRNELVKDVNF